MDGGINIFIQADINELSNNDLRILLGRHEKEIKELNKYMIIILVKVK